MRSVWCAGVLLGHAASWHNTGGIHMLSCCSTAAGTATSREKLLGTLLSNSEAQWLC